jgi:hypothetical protein
LFTGFRRRAVALLEDLDHAEKAVRAGFAARAVLRIEQPLVDRAVQRSQQATPALVAGRL